MTKRAEKIRDLLRERDKLDEEISRVQKEGKTENISLVEVLRKRRDRINDEITVESLGSIDAHSKRLEWLTVALIITSVALVVLTAVLVWRTLI